MKPKFWVVCVSTIAVLLLPKAAIAETVRVEAGNVEARLSYQMEDGQPGDGACVSDIRLRIERDGDRRLDQEITNEEACRTGEGMLKVQNLGDDAEPEVILDLHTEGAHCCTSSLIYRYDPQSNQYTSIEHSWGHVGYRLQDLDEDGTIELVSGDDRFAYAFSEFVSDRSSYPPQIWHYQNGALVDVTRRYRPAVYSRTYQIWQVYSAAQQQGYEVRSHLAAYLAAKHLLGEGADGWERVQQAYQDSDRQEFFANLGQFLRETGYTATATPAPSPTPSPSPVPRPSPTPPPSSSETLLREEGVLEPGDAVLPSDSSLFDRFTFEGEAGQRVTISLESTEFDTYLVLVNPDGTSLAQNDDISPADRNSRIAIELPTTGTFTVLANGFDSNSQGRYTLTITTP